MDALAAAAGLMVIAGVVLALLITPFMLVWPRAWARLVPRRFRGGFLNHPGRQTTLVTVVLAVWAAGSMSPLVLSSGEPGRSVTQKATAIALVWLIFGGLTGVAVARTLRVGIAQWALGAEVGQASHPSRWEVTQRQTRPTPAPAAFEHGEAMARPTVHAPDRALRNSGRWLAAGGLTWYVFGRVLQVSGVGGDEEVPDWWWYVTLVLLVVGAAVWITRRRRWRAQGRQHSLTSPGAAFDHVLTGAGLEVRRPAGSWVATWAPLAFVPESAATGPALWPWAATGVVRELPVLVAAQHVQLRNRTGLTGLAVRTACVLKLAGTRLPRVLIAERSAIPPQQRPSSIPLESEAFNRSMCVYGPDARGAYDVVHPRVMAHALRDLPDGTRVAMQGETLAVITDEPLSPVQLGEMLAFAVRLAELTPSYLRS